MHLFSSMGGRMVAACRVSAVWGECRQPGTLGWWRDAGGPGRGLAGLPLH